MKESAFRGVTFGLIYAFLATYILPYLFHEPNRHKTMDFVFRFIIFGFLMGLSQFRRYPDEGSLKANEPKQTATVKSTIALR